MGEPITLELHHINGNHYDNRLENLQILCPNCHSQTSSHRKRKDIKTIEIPKAKKRNSYTCICKQCGKEFNSDRERKFCSRECYNNNINQQKQENIITKEKLEKAIIECNTFSKLAEHFNVSRSTIKKYLITYNLLSLYEEKYNNGAIHSKKIIQYDLDMNFIKEWGSIADAEETLNIKSINQCVKNKRKTARRVYLEIC